MREVLLGRGPRCGLRMGSFPFQPAFVYQPDVLHRCPPPSDVVVAFLWRASYL